MSQLLYNTRQFDFKKLVLDIARSGALSQYLFIVPTERMAQDFSRRITAAHFEQESRPLEHLPIHTIHSFTAEFYGKLGTRRAIIPSEIQLLLIGKAMETIDLSYYGYGHGRISPGVVEGIARVIGGIRADGILPSDFQLDIEQAQRHPDDPKYARYDLDKLGDLYNIYSEYLRLLGDTWVDYPGQLLALNTELFQNRDEILRKAFPNLRSLLVYGFTELTQPETVLMQQLGMIRDLDVTIYFDYERTNGPLYGNFDDVIQKLIFAGYQRRDDDPLQPDIPESERRPFKHHMRSNLFRTDDRIPNHAFDRFVNVYGFYNRAEEVRGIAALIKWLHVEQGMKLSRICVTTLNMDPYTELFREQIASHGIPANITARFALEHNALITALFSALSILAGSYDRRDVLRAVTSPYLNFGEDVDPAALTEVSGRLRITRGRSTWAKRIERRIDFLNDRLIRIVPDPEDRATVEREIGTLRRAQRSIHAIGDHLKEFHLRMTPSQFRTAFLRLIATLGPVEQALALRNDLERRPRTAQDWMRIHDEVERDTRALSGLLRLLDELTTFYESSEDPNHEYPLDFYVDRLHTACARSIFRLREKHDHGVLIAPVNQIQGLEFDAVIVCGMVDGEFPQIYLPEIFLGKPLPDAEDRTLRRERVMFYQAVTSFNPDHGHLFFTYPRFSGDTELVRSPFLDAFLRITTLEDSDRVTTLDGLDGEQRKLREAGDDVPDHLRFLTLVPTLDALAEEAGSALWSGSTVPRITEKHAEEMLANLRHTAMVEQTRHRAKAEPELSEGNEYRGVIADALTEDERAELASRREEEYSISQLELYSKCPFRFFASRILRAAAPSGYDVTLTPLERGVMVHSVLFKLYTELSSQNKLPITQETREETIKRAKEIAKEEIEGITFDHPYWTIDKERLLGGEVFGGLLEGWIDAEVVRTEEKSALTPEFFEASFGTRGSGSAVDARLSTADHIVINDVRLRGRVDRIEIFHRGDEVLFAVADYKTGNPPTRGDILNGSSLQLMIYLEVVRSLLSRHFNLPLEKVRPVGGIYYKLDAREVAAEDKYIFVPNELKGKDNILDVKRYYLDPETIDDLQDIMTQTLNRAGGYVDGIASGLFHVTTRNVNQVCKGCEYQGVCRVKEVRV